MQKTVNAFVFMELAHPTDENGNPLWLLPKVWAPTVWKCRVDDVDHRIFIGKQSVEVEVPDDFNPIPSQVAALEAEKVAALEAYQVSVARINERLSKLLAISNEVQS